MRTQLVNLGFHGIGHPIGRDFGVGERDYWVSPKLFQATLEACVHRSDVSLSFDDGNWSDIAVVLPALREHGLSATFFINAGRLGQPGFIDRHDLRELVSAGMRIGNHGLAHLDLTKLEPARLEHEITQGRRLLEELTGTTVDTLAIAYGTYNDAVLEQLRRLAYRHVYTSDGGAADPEAWLQPREHVKAQHTALDVARLLTQD